MAAIAFIGLGQMGSPMASNLLQQGHQLRVFDVNAEAVRHLVDKGATPAANPAQAAKDAEFIITMLPNGDLVRNVLFGENGVCEGLSTDALVIDMSTIHPLQTDKRDCCHNPLLNTVMSLFVIYDMPCLSVFDRICNLSSKN